jgi:DNA-binding transcriptional LysR family regulator
MEMHQVRYFLAVAEELNFTRAAERCHVAQPSLTRAIKLLEQELGGPLFHREGGRTHLSELGRMVQPYLSGIYAQADAAKQHAAEFTKLKRTPLRLGIMCTIAPKHLVDLIHALQKDHTGIELQLVDAAWRSLEERLLEGDLEVAIYCCGKAEEHERLHYLPLFKEPYMVALASQDPLTKQNAVRARDLTGARYLNRTKCELNDYAGPILHAHGAAYHMVYQSERDDWILAMIAAGLGFGLMPENCIAHPNVVARPLIDPELWRQVNLVSVRGRPHSPAVGALVREAMRTPWFGKPALARRAELESAVPAP